MKNLRKWPTSSEWGDHWKDTRLKKLTEQGFKCAICETDLTIDAGKRHGCLDHNHETGTIRNVLCIGCNAGIGSFGEDTDKMLKAIQYVKRWRFKERLSNRLDENKGV